MSELPPDELKPIFDKFAKGDGLIQFDEFEDICKSLKIRFEGPEVRRVYDQILEEGDLDFQHFCVAMRRWTFLASVITSNSKVTTFTVPPYYAWDKSTYDNYATTSTEIEPTFEEHRKELLAEGFRNFTVERQRWQDEVAQSIIEKTPEQNRPWIVVTCGIPGVGKTYALSWMSKHEFFPLENIVRIDPDQFKTVMPEWSEYRKRDEPQAADKCHEESAYLRNLCWAVAMNKKQNIWVDSTLRNYESYRKRFREIRRKHPDYRIAIFHVSASDEEIRRRLDSREKETGRVVKPDVVEYAKKELPKAIEALILDVDFVARILNEGGAPVIDAIQSIDHSSSWNLIRQNFAQIVPSPSEFPQSLAPMFLIRTPLTFENIRLVKVRPSRVKIEISENALGTGRKRIIFKGSRTHFVNLDSESRKLALIPEDAYAFGWLYTDSTGFSLPPETHNEQVIPCDELLKYGGFFYLDKAGKIIAVNAATVEPQTTMIQFGVPKTLETSIATKLSRDRRWRPVTVDFMREKGATAYAWITPSEDFSVRQLMPPYGSFAYAFGKMQYVYFPVTSSAWE